MLHKNPYMLRHVPDHLKTQKMCYKAMVFNPYMLRHAPHHFKMQEMCDTAMRMDLDTIHFIIYDVILSMPSVLILLIPDRFKTERAEMCNKAVEKNPHMLKDVPDCFKTKEMCSKVVRMDSWLLKYIPDRFKTQDMCYEAVEEDLSNLRYVSDHFKMQEICDKTLCMEPLLLMYILDHLKTKGLCDKAVRDDPSPLQYILQRGGVIFSYHSCPTLPVCFLDTLCINYAKSCNKKQLRSMYVQQQIQRPCLKNLKWHQQYFPR